MRYTLLYVEAGLGSHLESMVCDRTVVHSEGMLIPINIWCLDLMEGLLAVALFLIAQSAMCG